MDNTKTAKHWYVVRTRPRTEKRVKEGLLQNNLDAFLPLYQKIVQWSDRKKKLWTPLFPGYIFVRLCAKEMNCIYDIPGALKFISTDGVKDVIPDKEIETIKHVLQNKTQVLDVSDDFGKEVKILSGGFAGQLGVLMKAKGKNKVLVQLSLAGQTMTLETSSHNLTTC